MKRDSDDFQQTVMWSLDLTPGLVVPDSCAPVALIASTGSAGPSLNLGLMGRPERTGDIDSVVALIDTLRQVIPIDSMAEKRNLVLGSMSPELLGLIAQAHRVRMRLYGSVAWCTLEFDATTRAMMYLLALRSVAGEWR